MSLPFDDLIDKGVRNTESSGQLCLCHTFTIEELRQAASPNPERQRKEPPSQKIHNVDKLYHAYFKEVNDDEN